MRCQATTRLGYRCSNPASVRVEDDATGTVHPVCHVHAAGRCGEPIPKVERGAKARELTDAQRIDPAMIRRWWVGIGGHFTIVLATCQEEALAVAGYWIGKASRREVHLLEARVRVATGEDVDRWTELRAATVDSCREDHPERWKLPQ